MGVGAMILGLGLVLVVAYLVGYPLVRPSEEGRGLEDLVLEGGDALEREKESVFTALGEIEFDYRMNKLSDRDYRELEREYKEQAVALLKAEEEEGLSELPSLRRPDVLEDEIEKEIEAEIEEELSRLRGRGR